MPFWPWPALISTAGNASAIRTAGQFFRGSNARIAAAYARPVVASHAATAAPYGRNASGRQISRNGGG
jgi:hypothetical protein